MSRSGIRQRLAGISTFELAKLECFICEKAGKIIWYLANEKYPVCESCAEGLENLEWDPESSAEQIKADFLRRGKRAEN